MGEWIDWSWKMKWDPDRHSFVGPVSFLAASQESKLRGLLESLGFDVFTVEGDRAHDEKSLHTELARVFAFPDYYGKNWDAFDECFTEFCEAQSGPLAIFLRGADQLSDRALKPFLELVVMFDRHAERMRTAKDDRDLLQTDLVYLGSEERGFVAKPLGVRERFPHL